MEAEDNSNPGRPAVHRLHRTEYTNAVRDLLDLETDAQILLPAYGTDFGFDNIADSLNISPLLLERYMMAASKVSRLAIGDNNVRPSTKIYNISQLLQQRTTVWVKTCRLDHEVDIPSGTISRSMGST